MIVGTVNARVEIVLPFAIADSTGHVHDMEAVLDTGFTGSLTLPPPFVAALGLPWHSRSIAILANGQIDAFEMHKATIVWDGAPRLILVQASNTVPLVGLELMTGNDLRVRFAPGGRAEIEKIL